MSGVQPTPTRSDHEDPVRWQCWKRASDCCINRDHPQTDQRTLADLQGLSVKAILEACSSTP